MPRPTKDYDKLKALLEDQESFPIRFTYKFIGKNTAQFASSVAGFEAAHPDLSLEGTRSSSGGNHVAKTYGYVAPDADAIIRVFRAIEHIDDLVIML